MKILTLLLIAVCYLPVGAQKRTRTKRASTADPLTALTQKVEVDEDGWAMLFSNDDMTYQY
jgi:hypothetical protein